MADTIDRFKTLGTMAAAILALTAIPTNAVHGDEGRGGDDESALERTPSSIEERSSDELGGGEDGGGSLRSLILAAAIAWALLAAFVIFQFQRQRALAEELRRISAALDEGLQKPRGD